MNNSYPGGKSGAGIFQRLINLIPRHRILIVPFAGHCGVVRNIRPAEHTIVIDQNPSVCQWWADWSRSKQGRYIEIHHCDGIEWLRFTLGCTKFDAAASDAADGDRRSQPRSSAPSGGDGRSSGSGREPRLVMEDEKRIATELRMARQQVMLLEASSNADPKALRGARDSVVYWTGKLSNCDRKSPNSAFGSSDAQSRGSAESQESVAEAFIFADPPYVLSERSGGRIYECELTDEDHQRFLGTVTQLDAAKYSAMICGYACDLYSPLDRWFSIDHRVPTRGGLQDERIWMNYPKPVKLHDYRYIGDTRRSRERIRRRQKNWHEQLMQMSEQERLAMLEVLNSTQVKS